MLPDSLRARLEAWLRGLMGYGLMLVCLAAAASLLTWSATDPSYVRTASGPIRNVLGPAGANLSDLGMRLLGLAAVFILLPPTFWGLELITRRQLEDWRLKVTLAPVAVLLLSSALSALPVPPAWPVPYGLGGLLGDQSLRFLASLLTAATPVHAATLAGVACLVGGLILLTGSLGMSLQDLILICRGQRSRDSLAARAWQGLSRAFERADPPVYERREPTFELPPRTMTVGRQPSFPIEPAFGYEPEPAAPYGERWDRPATRRAARPRRATREIEPEPEQGSGGGDFEQTTETRSRAMAKRFAPPARDEAGGLMGFGFFFRRRGGNAQRRGAAAPSEPRPIWPGSVPVPADEDMPAPEPELRPIGDDLYRRAVALVRAQRKASTAYLQQSLGIGYMRAADLIERMEQEGVVGPPIYNGIRPILTAAPGTRIV